jgi:peptidoglycan/xylan/chitin deacetylase (PgdA/CDA1 family)
VIKKHVLFLSLYYKFIDATEFVLLFRQEKKIIENCIFLTFDDGYKSFYSDVYPILRRLNIPSVVFIPTAFVGTEKLIWTDYLRTAIIESLNKSIMVDGKKYNLNSETKRKEVYQHFSTMCKKMNHNEREKIINDLIKVSQDDYKNEIKYQILSWDQIGKMAKAKVEFGSHTHTHPILSTIEKSEIKDELKVSKTIIEGKLKKKIKLFAYPNGKKRDYNKDVLNSLKELKYKYAFTTQQGKVNLNMNPYEINRILLFEKHGLFEVALKVLFK